MDIAHLKTFLEIYQTRHFGKAAEKLFITQSAASARIKHLEERLGVKLFIRDKRSTEPTSAAHRFHKYAEVAVNSWDQARRVVALPEEYQLSLSIACMADIWHMFLNHWIDDIQSLQEGIALNLNISPSNEIFNLLINGGLDLGLVFEPTHTAALEVQEIASFEIKLFSTEQQTTITQCFSKNYIMVDWGATFAYEYSQCFTDNSSAIQTNYGVVALDILQTRGGSAYLPELALKRTEDSISLWEVKNAPVFTRKLYAVYRKNCELNDLIQQIIVKIRQKLMIEQEDIKDPIQ